MDAEEKPAKPDIMKERDTATVGHPRNNMGQSRSFASFRDQIVYQPNIYVPQAPALCYRGYENPSSDWDEYPSYFNAEGMGIGSQGVYNDNPSLVYHPGYGFSPQMPYGPYSHATPPLSSVGGDAQLYSPQQFPYSGPAFYPQPGPPSIPFITSPAPVAQPDLNTLASIGHQGDNMIVGPRPNYPSPVGSFGRGSFPGNLGTVGSHDMMRGVDGFRSGGIWSGGLWSDWVTPIDRHNSVTPFSPAVSPQPIGTFGSFGQNVRMASQSQRAAFYGAGSGSNSYGRGYQHGGFNQGPSFGSAFKSSLGVNNRGWLSLENSKPWGRGNVSLCGCNGGLDIFSEQNRGPRASKPKSQDAALDGSTDNNSHGKPTGKIREESYNHPDFTTEYKDAKFFIIKSYSEDNVHKSIKYGVWASTPNGNKKLDAAYREAKEKQELCPVFLFFSVNASGQFCGIAEMFGAVDFDKSVDYWQQDKWSGQFPVKWHIIKDVPNSHFRHILLETNDNKPVTNSRDTQEVKLDKGNEMLKIFKNCETDMSILDDFDFYEDRQKALQECKAKQQATLMAAAGILVENEPENTVTLPNDFIKQMSNSFAQVVHLDESRKEGNATEITTSGSDSLSTGVGLDNASGAVSAAQAS